MLDGAEIGDSCIDENGVELAESVSDGLGDILLARDIAGVGPEDKRVQAALTWIGKHYSVTQNPGMGQAGVFYYYHTFAKAMDALGEDQFEDAKGVKHDWRKELALALNKRQRPDGSFVNAGDRTFGESDPNLATAFALLTLSYTRSR